MVWVCHVVHPAIYLLKNMWMVSGLGLLWFTCTVVFHRVVSLQSRSPAEGTVWKAVGILVLWLLAEVLCGVTLKVTSPLLSANVKGLYCMLQPPGTLPPLPSRDGLHCELRLTCLHLVALSGTWSQWWEKWMTHWLLGIKLLWTMTKGFLCEQKYDILSD